MTKGEKRNCKIDLRDFLHGIIEHILQIKEMQHKKWNVKKKQKFEDEIKVEASSFFILGRWKEGRSSKQTG